MDTQRKDLDAVGDVIRKEKHRRAKVLKVKLMGWFIVVILILSLLLFAKIAS